MKIAARDQFETGLGSLVNTEWVAFGSLPYASDRRLAEEGFANTGQLALNLRHFSIVVLNRYGEVGLVRKSDIPAFSPSLLKASSGHAVWAITGIWAVTGLFFNLNGLDSPQLAAQNLFPYHLPKSVIPARF